MDLQDGGLLRFSIGTIVAIFDLQVTLMLLAKIQVNWLSVQEKKLKIDFQDGGPGGHLRFPVETILTI